jgi:hypothetical protein
LKLPTRYFLSGFAKEGGTQAKTRMPKPCAQKEKAKQESGGILQAKFFKKSVAHCEH